MPDIALCSNETCPSRKTCYRHEAKSAGCWQAYAAFVVHEGRDKCEDYMPLRQNNSQEKPNE